MTAPSFVLLQQLAPRTAVWKIIAELFYPKNVSTAATSWFIDQARSLSYIVLKPCIPDTRRKDISLEYSIAQFEELRTGYIIASGKMSIVNSGAHTSRQRMCATIV